MKVIFTVRELSTCLGKAGVTPVGLVPTMGALHAGHISLVEKAARECPVVVVSIYVNPTQFNDKNDLRNYPRTMDADLSLLRKCLRENDIVFTPDDREVYPVPDNRVFSFGNLDNVMEALHRPGHFNGVAQVVSRLFEMVKPDVAFFGLKDFQQVAVIKSLVRQLIFNITIQTCPIIRENDGLAMSSRNTLLEKGIREKAPVIYRTISRAAELIQTIDIPEIKKFVKDSIEKEEGFMLEYFEIADDTDLIPVKARSGMMPGKRYFGCIAVRAGKIRLIDNTEIPLV
jgi:pantoate--beta-alanine ligase